MNCQESGMSCGSEFQFVPIDYMIIYELCFCVSYILNIFQLPVLALGEIFACAVFDCISFELNSMLVFIHSLFLQPSLYSLIWSLTVFNYAITWLYCALDSSLCFLVTS